MEMKAEEEALNLLKKYGGPPWKWSHRFVSWSGGKDSTVCLHLALRVWDDFETIFVNTGIALPETLEYVRRISKEWDLNCVTLKPEIDFWSYVAYAGFPIVTALWCRRLLKLAPIKKFYKKRPGWKLQVLGLRKAESLARRKQPIFGWSKRQKYTYGLCPILNWSDREVRNYIREYEIPLNPVYKEYRTSGCYFCPFVRNPKHYLALKRNHPNLFKNIVDAERNMEKWGTAWPGKSIIPILEQQFLAVNGSLGCSRVKSI